MQINPISQYTNIFNVKPKASEPVASAGAEPLFQADSLELSDDAKDILKRRGLDDAEVLAFAEIVRDAEDATDKKAFIKSLSVEDRDLLKRANSYGRKLTHSEIDGFSEEGAYNFLVDQTKRTKVDFNNDGMVEHGQAMTFVFPPPNSPDHIKDAYDEFTKDMDMKERLKIEIYFMSQSLTANIKYDGSGKTVGFYFPGEEGYTNIYEGNSDSTWKGIFNKIHNYFDLLEDLGEARPEDEKLISEFENMVFGN